MRWLVAARIGGFDAVVVVFSQGEFSGFPY